VRRSLSRPGFLFEELDVVIERGRGDEGGGALLDSAEPSGLDLLVDDAADRPVSFTTVLILNITGAGWVVVM